MYPDRLARVLPLVDWIGLDVKAPRAVYPRITGVPAAGDAVFDSLRLILNTGVDYELRCTWHPDLLPAADLATLGDELIAQGANRLVVQECRPTGHAAALPTVPPARHDGFAHFALRAA